MNEHTPASAAAVNDSPKVVAAKHKFAWFPQILLVGIFGWAVAMKLFIPEGAGPLASKLPGGEAAVWIIGTVELIALVLLLIPATAVQGAVVAGMVMLFAITAHLSGVVGFAGQFALMFVLALIGFASATAVVVLRKDQLLRFGGR